MRFAVGDVVTGDDGFEAVANAGAFEHRLHFGATGRGDNGEFKTIQLAEKIASGLGNGGIGVRFVAKKGLLFRVILPEILYVMGRVLLFRQDFEHGAVRDTDAVGAIGFPGEGDTEGSEDGGPAFKVNAFAVGEYAIEIEKDGVKRHGGELQGTKNERPKVGTFGRVRRMMAGELRGGAGEMNLTQGEFKALQGVDELGGIDRFDAEPVEHQP